MIDLEKDYLQLVHSILKQYVPDCEVRAFGSRVDGRSGRFSDLDLVVICKKQLDWEKLESLKDAFSASDLPIMVDVLDWHMISGNFRQLINKKYEVVQSASDSD